MPKVSQEHRDARRAQILDAARRCFLRDGFHATSMQDLFAEAGLSAGAVYLYFDSKDDVIIAIAEENMRDVVALIRGRITSRSARSLGGDLSDILDMIRKKHAADQLGGIAVLVWSEALRNPALAKRFDEALRQMRTDLAAIFRTHQVHADAPGGATPEALAALFMTIIPGYLLQLSLFGPRAVTGVRNAVQAVWSS